MLAQFKDRESVTFWLPITTDLVLALDNLLVENSISVPVSKIRAQLNKLSLNEIYYRLLSSRDNWTLLTPREIIKLRKLAQP
jgi:hypothetical protein